MLSNIPPVRITQIDVVRKIIERNAEDKITEYLKPFCVS